MDKYVLHFHEIDRNDLPQAGGKGANLGEMTKAGLPVPQGFCVTTAAYRAFLQASREMEGLFDRLDRLRHDDLDGIRPLGERIRGHLAATPVPPDIEAAIAAAWRQTGEGKAYAVRSSATAEDLPTASFAGQQDTYLNVRGRERLIAAVRQCWASLFTDRAISYRAKNGFDHRSVYLSVVVQEMVFPEVSGIMFTADPVTGHRQTVSIDASFGLGEALVSGLVSADLYQVRSGRIVNKQISRKELAIEAAPEGGTITRKLPPERQNGQALTDERIVQLAALGRRIEQHYGAEQDIEWGLAGGTFYILQSRPITSLYPLLPAPDERLRVYVNFGYIQMMTDPMKPLAISVLSYVAGFVKDDPASSDKPFLREAGGRAFADLTEVLSLRPVRGRLLKIIGGMDERMASALSEVVERNEFRQTSMPMGRLLPVVRRLAPIFLPAAWKVLGNLLWKNPLQAPAAAEALIDRLTAETGRAMRELSGAERIRRIQQEMGTIFPRVLSKVAVYLVSGVLSSIMLENMLSKRVGADRAASLLGRLYKSLPGNITTEMGLELGDLADLARRHPQLADSLQRADDGSFREGLDKLPGGPELRRGLERFLQKYGMRCAGEVDITKPRWREAPAQLVPAIVSHIRSSAEGEHRRKFRDGEREAEAAAREIAALFESRAWDKRKAVRLVALYRPLMGMREHHKYALVRLLDHYKRAILEEAEALAGRGVLRHPEDVFYLTLEELAALLDKRHDGSVQTTIETRKAQHERNGKMPTPRVMTSDGEIVAGKLREVQAPEGAVRGTPVSAGVVEGVARVVLRPEDARLKQGDILIAPYTDPGWTPLFTSVVGLITEVGGTMTHGSVIAREYGIPAVVGIEKATEIIPDGAYIRVDGTQGFVVLLNRPQE